MTALVSSSTPSVFFCEVKKIYRDNSDLIRNISLLALNSVILIGRIFKETIPAYVTRGAYVIMSFTGVLYFDDQIRELIKSGKDLWRAIQAKDGEAIVFTAAKVAVKGLNILLTSALLGASVLSLCGMGHISLVMYGILLPFSLFSLFTGIGTSIYDFQKNDYLLGRIEKINQASEKEKRVQKVMKNFLQVLEGNKSESRLARHIFQQMDCFTVDKHLEEVRKRGSIDDAYRIRLFEDIGLALKQIKLNTQQNLGAIALGYASMMLLKICKIHPETVISVGVNWGFSSFYAYQSIGRKINRDERKKTLEKY